MTGQNASQDEAVLAHRLFLENGGAVPESSPARYETAAEMKEEAEALRTLQQRESEAEQAEKKAAKKEAKLAAKEERAALKKEKKKNLKS